MTDFIFRPLSESDLPCLTKWLNSSHLQTWWRKGEVSLNEVREKYLPRLSEREETFPFLVLLNKKPFGYIQYSIVTEKNKEWWPDNPAPGTVGIDQFIGEKDHLNQGLGTRMVSAFITKLFGEYPWISEIRLDPHPENLRAIRCYEKVGFRRIQTFTSPDGPAVLMILTKKKL